MKKFRLLVALAVLGLTSQTWADNYFGGGSATAIPAGPAGGDLTGTYPDPTITVNAVALGTDTTGGYAGSASEGGAATTATALSANGANCSAGNYPLGIDASGAVESCTAASVGTLTGTGTTGLVAEWTGAAALGNSNAYPIIRANAGVTGTTVNKLAKLDSAAAVVITGAAETAGVLGIVESGAGTTGSAIIATLGDSQCVFEDATTAGNLFGVSESVAGNCQDLGVTGATGAPAGTIVLGTVTETGAAGTRTVLLGTPDIQGGAGGGGNKNPAGAAGDVQYRAAGNNFAAETNFNYDASNNRLQLSSMTSDTDNDPNMVDISGTLPAVPSVGVNGVDIAIATAGSANFSQRALSVSLTSGYTGNQSTQAILTSNNAAGIATTLNLNATAGALGNGVFAGQVTGSTVGNNLAIVGDAQNSTGLNTGVFGKANAAVAGSNIGLLGNASASTEATDLKNVGVYGTLDSALIAGVNGSFAGLFDGGTLPDANSNALRVQATLPAAPSAGAVGIIDTITSAGSAAQSQTGEALTLAAGYSGSSSTTGLIAVNATVGTGATLNLGSGTPIVGNSAMLGTTTTTTAGINAGVVGRAHASTNINIAGLFKSFSNAAGTHIGTLGNAGGSSEGTDLKNVGGYFTLDNTLITGANISVALLAQGDGTDDIFRGYDDTTLIFRMEDTGEFTSAGTTSIGWSVVAGADTACNTTCTNACVVGFAQAVTGDDVVACTDATADSCLCAGAS